MASKTKRPMQLLPVQIILPIRKEVTMNIDTIYEQIKAANQELEFARLQASAAEKQVTVYEKKIRELVAQLAKLTGVSVGNNAKATKVVYTEAEDNKLRAMWEEGSTAREISEVLGKNPASVNSRIVRFKLSRRPRIKQEAA